MTALSLGLGLGLGRVRDHDSYRVMDFTPALVADFATPGEYYRKASGGTTFDGLLTHTRSGNATMFDSDGLLKWAPHNLALNSATPATQSITVVSGADYTVEIAGSGSVALSGAGNGTVTDGNPVEITASTTSLTLTVTGSPDRMWAYRSDLGGMVNNPDRGDSYVPTEASAVYMSRRNAHVYNSTLGAWQNKGIQIETEARTNLLTHSEDFSDASWTKYGATVALDEVGPDGVTNSAATLTASGATAYVYASATTVAGSATLSAFVKAGTADVVWLYWKNAAGEGSAYFDLSDQTTQVGAGSNQTPSNLLIEDLDGFYRVSATWSVGAESANAGVGMGDAKGATTTTVGKTMVLFGAQFEAGATPSSYTPTNGATATRAADALTIPAANHIAAGGMPSALSIQMDGLMTYADEDEAFTVEFIEWAADASNEIIWYQDTRTSDDELNFGQRASGTFDGVNDASVNYAAGVDVPFNIAGVHTTGRVNGAVDGDALTEDATPTALPDLSSTDIQIGYDFMGFLTQFRMWDADITDAGLEAATS